MFYKKLKILFSLVIFFSSPVFANPFVDVYGTDEETANKIVEKFGEDIYRLAECAVNIQSANTGSFTAEDLAKAKKKSFPA